MNTNNKFFINLFALLPLVHLTLIIGSLIQFVLKLNLFNGLNLLFVAYLFPPLFWRLIDLMLPAQLGISNLDNNNHQFNTWLISFHLQRNYNQFPIMENILKLIPGLYSTWLSLWGAEINTKINWKWKTKIIDRPFIKIKNNSTLHEVDTICSHQIIKKGNQSFLSLEKVIY